MATFEIPKGKVITYKQVAERIGNRKAFRAVGNALRKNPIPITIPCHRVIRSNGELGNYDGPGEKGRKRKRELLIRERAIPL